MPDDDDRRRAATQVFIDAEALDADGSVALSDEVEHHLTRVLRLRAGEAVSIADGAGRWRMGVITAAGLEPTSDVVTDARRGQELTIATAIPKGDRLDWLVQKATELGADRLQFLHCDHSVVRWKQDRAVKQLDRLRRVSLEAARQSRRLWLLDIDGPIDARDVLPGSSAAEPGGRAVTPHDSFIAIGPEGGWSADERALAGGTVSLGRNVLRTETAVLAAITLCVTNRH